MSQPSVYDEYVQTYANHLISALEKGAAPWQKPWVPGQGMNCPYNATTGKGYSGGNAIWLMMRQEMEGYTDSRWLTYKQGQQLEAQVRRGEKGTKLVKWLETKSKNKSEGADEGEEEGGRKRLVPIVFTVFNAEQLDNMPPAPVRQLPGEFERHAQCERLLDDVRAMGVLIEHDGGNRAFYVPSEDAIHLPAREQFVAADGYYATALHECGHATGHPSRLGRDLTGRYGTENYAREELRAEIASMMAGDRLGIGHDPGQHAAYVGHWIKILKDDPKEIFRACRDAETICQHLGIEKYVMAATEKLEAGQDQTKEAALEAARQGPWSPSPDESERLAARIAQPRARERGQSAGMAM